MKNIVFLLLLLLLFGCQKAPVKGEKASYRKQMVLYCDDEFMASGLGQKVIPVFETKYKCHVDVVNCKETSVMMERLEKEKGSPKADVAIGFNQTHVPEILQFNLMEAYHPTGLSVISTDHIIDRDFHVTPYGFAHMGIIYDEAMVSKPPENFGELQDGMYANQLLVPDAIRSGIGRASLTWSVSAFGETGYQAFWQSIKRNVAEFTPTWSEARQKFRQDGYSMMIGFTTTPAFYSETLKYDGVHCLVPREGSFVYIPAAGLIRKAKHADMGKKFLDFMISEQFQKQVPFTQYIYPIDKTIEMPLSFSFAPMAVYTLNKNLSYEQLNTGLPDWLAFWKQYVDFF